MKQLYQPLDIFLRLSRPFVNLFAEAAEEEEEEEEKAEEEAEEAIIVEVFTFFSAMLRV